MSHNATLENRPATVDHAAESPARPSYDDVNTPVIVLIGVISAVVTLLVIWAVEGLYYHWSSQLIRERTYDVANPRQVDLIDAQKEQLLGIPDQQVESLESVIPDVLARYRTATGSAESSTSDASESSGNREGDH